MSVQEELYAGQSSLRVPGERGSLWISMALAPLTLSAIGLVFHSISLSGFVLLVVAAMVYVTMARGRLLGDSVKVGPHQFGEVHAMIADIAGRLGMEAPQVFVRDDVFVPVSASGMGEPYSLVLSSQYLEHLHEAELRFLLGREMAHIAAGHTRLTSLLSTSGRENPAVAFVFGPWLRRTEYTADRVGLVCGASLDDAIRAISITSFHVLGRRVDMRLLADQRREIEREPTLRMGEWVVGMPYAAHRVVALESFEASPLAQYWRERLRAPAPAGPEIAAGPAARVTRRDCAPAPRRLNAALIDLALVSAIFDALPQFRVSDEEPSAKAHAALAHVQTAGGADDMPQFAHWLFSHATFVGFTAATAFALLGFFIYSAVLVGLCGQTLGMMVMELRVVTTEKERAGLLRVAWRYLAALASVATSVAFFCMLFRIHPHDRVSGTRVVRSRLESAKAAR